MKEPPRRDPGRETGRVARDDRLARALRDNLGRRKEQARAREAPEPSPPPKKQPTATG